MTKLASLKAPHHVSDNYNINNQNKRLETIRNMNEANILGRKQIKSKPSSLKSDKNPSTIARETKLKEGPPLKVTFDERVVVHTVSHCGRRGRTFYHTIANESHKSYNNNKPKRPSTVAKKKRKHRQRSVFLVVTCVILLICI